LTITESHGFHVVIAAVAWIVGLLAALGHGLWNLSCGNRQIARMDVGSKSWLHILIRRHAVAHREPVLWFDTMGRRAGPRTWAAHHRLELHDRSSHHCLALAVAEPATLRRRGSRRTELDTTSQAVSVTQRSTGRSWPAPVIGDRSSPIRRRAYLSG
jgi:hypothetical protein